MTRTLTIAILVAMTTTSAFGQYGRRVAPRGYHAAMARSAPRYYVPPVRRTTVVRHHTVVVPAPRPSFSWGVVVGSAVRGAMAPLVQPRPVIMAPAPAVVNQTTVIDQRVSVTGDGNIVQNGSPGPGGAVTTAVGGHPNLPPGLPLGSVVLEVDYHEHGDDAGQVDEVLVQLPGGTTAKFEWEDGKWEQD
jgi:hypothetical protein